MALEDKDPIDADMEDVTNSEPLVQCVEEPGDPMEGPREIATKTTNSRRHPRLLGHQCQSMRNPYPLMYARRIRW